jgi:hypothetical protein
VESGFGAKVYKVGGEFRVLFSQRPVDRGRGVFLAGGYVGAMVEQPLGGGGVAFFGGVAERGTGVEVGLVNPSAKFQQAFEDWFRGGGRGGCVEGSFAAVLALGDIAFVFEEALGDIPVPMLKGQAKG